MTGHKFFIDGSQFGSGAVKGKGPFKAHLGGAVRIFGQVAVFVVAAFFVVVLKYNNNNNNRSKSHFDFVRDKTSTRNGTLFFHFHSQANKQHQQYVR